MICMKNYGLCNTEIGHDPWRIFVLMPFDERVSPQSLYNEVLATLPDWRVTRADRGLSAPEIMCRICANIQKSRAVVADLTGSNPNVFLELGLSWGVGTPYILLTQRIQDLPFDTRTFHVVRYERDPLDSTKVADPDSLRAEVQRILTSLPEPPLGALATTREGTLYQEVQRTKASVAGTKFWRLIEGSWRIIGVDNVADRICVSLLHSYPNAKIVSLVAAEAHVSPQLVYMYVNGERGNHAAYFHRSVNGLGLTDEGLYWAIETAVPRIVM